MWRSLSLEEVSPTQRLLFVLLGLLLQAAAEVPARGTHDSHCPAALYHQLMYEYAMLRVPAKSLLLAQPD